MNEEFAKAIAREILELKNIKVDIGTLSNSFKSLSDELKKSREESKKSLAQIHERYGIPEMHDESPVIEHTADESLSQRGTSVSRSGINKVHPHLFRHSFAINLIRQEWDVRRLQLLLGHAGMQTTAQYLRFGDKDIKEMYDRTIF
jgi:integrase